MKLKFLVAGLLFFIGNFSSLGQVPIFGDETPVNIIGLPHDAMEPHISPDGNALFFNSLNDGITTSVYYAARINDSTFNYLGLFPVVNQTITPRLDAVASLDNNDNFYWVSTRGYPDTMENLFNVNFTNPTPENFGRVYGNIYRYEPGWIIMDAAIDHNGDKLLYCNAHFTTCGGLPCFSKLSIANKVNDTTFLRDVNSDFYLNNVNDTINYINYAPALTVDGLELYYTRAPIGGSSTEILVATRPDINSQFSSPTILDNTPYVPEGPTLTTDKQIMYYHKKYGSTYQIYMRRRTGTTEVKEKNLNTVKVSPNPVQDVLNVSLEYTFKGDVKILDERGTTVLISSIRKKDFKIDLQHLSTGEYYLIVGNRITTFLKL